MQPFFEKSDQKFRGIQTVVSASVATDDSGNKHTVNRNKLLGILKCGLQSAGDFEQLNGVWLTWSFQVNFMFKPVL
eukprot:12157329-Ditylum_brightwellii.AAC.1